MDHIKAQILRFPLLFSECFGTPGLGAEFAFPSKSHIAAALTSFSINTLLIPARHVGRDTGMGDFVFFTVGNQNKNHTDNSGLCLLLLRLKRSEPKITHVRLQGA